MRALKALGLAGALLVLAPRLAHAADSVDLPEHDEKGWFDKFGRVGGFYGVVRGSRPVGGGSANTASLGDESFERSGFGVDFDLMGYWDATRFKTLIGAEMTMKLGQYKGESTDAAAAEKSYWMFRWDAAFDYGLVHWDGPIKGRIAGGAGGGFDLDGGKWYASKGRMYPLLLARVQLWPGEKLGLHASYHHVPTTANDNLVREHRFEGAAGLGPLHAGLRLTITRARPQGTEVDFYARELGAFVAYAF